MDNSEVKHLNKVDDDNEENLPRLENWLRWGSVILGNVYNRPPFPDGELIRTSRVLWLYRDRCQTRNTLYVLGTPA